MIETYNFIKKRLRYRCFLVTFAKKRNKILNVTNFNLETSRKICYSIQKYIQNPVKHLRWSFLGEIVNDWKLFTIFEENFIVDVRLGSKYASSIHHQTSYFIKSTFRKSGSPIFWKSGPRAKIRCIGQKHLNDKLEVSDFKYDNNFFKKIAA